MHVVTVAVVLVLGAATLLLHDKRFIQWKPTVLLALTALAFLGSTVIGKQPLARRMLEGVFKRAARHLPRGVAASSMRSGRAGSRCSPPPTSTSRTTFAESVWVNFKVFGITSAMLLFMIPQVLWLSGKVPSGRPPRPGPRHDAGSGKASSPEAAASREQRLRARLEAEFAPLELLVEDESHHHAGHAGAAGGHESFSRPHRRRGLSRRSARGAPPAGVRGARRTC